MTSTLDTVREASAKQVGFIIDLIKQRPTWVTDMPVDSRVLVFDILTNTTNVEKTFIPFSGADTAIKLLLKIKPSTQVVVRPFTQLQDILKTVNPGFYALYRKSTGDLDFFEVTERPAKGGKGHVRWVNRLIGSPGDWKRDRMSVTSQISAARVIASDVKEAAITYATHFLQCPRCNSPLSTKRSLTAKIGPKCASEWGWPY